MEMQKDRGIESALARGEQAMMEKLTRKRIGFANLLGRQVRFVGWRIWFMQGLGMLLLYSVCKTILQGTLGGYVQNIAFFLSCVSVLILLSAVPMVYRSIRYMMYETELATRFSGVRLLAVRLLAVGAGNLAMLGVILFFTSSRASISAARALLYLLMPYLTASGGFLYLLKRVPADKMQIYSISWGCFLVCVFTVLRRFWPMFFQQTFSGFWGAICLGLLLFCIRQFHGLMYDSAYTKMYGN
ncbi:MAG: hypothetical protein NC434_12750 [Ruminococcus sp.]|nr:hypothetical protein [Ruminococcus sp.]